MSDKFAIIVIIIIIIIIIITFFPNPQECRNALSVQCEFGRNDGLK